MVIEAKETLDSLLWRRPGSGNISSRAFNEARAFAHAPGRATHLTLPHQGWATALGGGDGFTAIRRRQWPLQPYAHHLRALSRKPNWRSLFSSSALTLLIKVQFIGRYAWSLSQAKSAGQFYAPNAMRQTRQYRISRNQSGLAPIALQKSSAAEEPTF
jgi:hypothetical protein